MKVDTRPYFLNPHRDNEPHCVVCDEPIWRPHRDDCRWREVFHVDEHRLELYEELIAVGALVFAAWMVGQIVAGFIT